MDEFESYRGVAQRHIFEQCFYMLVFGLLGTQKLFSRRYIVKQFQYFDLGSLWQGIGHRIGAFPRLQLPGAIGLLRAGYQGQTRNRCNTGQGFTAKPERGDVFQICQAVDLARGMAGQRTHQLITIDTATIINNPNQPRTTRIDFDGNCPGTRIETVFN